MKQTEVVRLPRAFIRSETPNTLTQSKLVKAFITLSQKEDGLLSGEYEMPRELFRQMMNMHNDQFMRGAMESVVGKKYVWESEDKKEGSVVTPISGVEWNTDTVSWEVSKKFANLVRKINAEGYTYLEWNILMEFSSVYALRIWELCKASAKANTASRTPKWSLPELRSTLHVPDTAYRGHNQAGALIQCCVTKPLKEAVEIGGLDITFHRRGRAASARYWFEIGPNKLPQQKILPDNGMGSAVKYLGDRRERIEAALAAASPEKRDTILKELGPVPSTDRDLRSYQAAMWGSPYDIKV